MVVSQEFFGKELLEKIDTCPDCFGCTKALVMIPVVAPVSPVSPAGRFPAWAASWRWRACPTAWRWRLPMSLWREIAGVDGGGAGSLMPV